MRRKELEHVGKGCRISNSLPKHKSTLAPVIGAAINALPTVGNYNPGVYYVGILLVTITPSVFVS